jgi:hypothetical protein
MRAIVENGAMSGEDLSESNGLDVPALESKVTGETKVLVECDAFARVDEIVLGPASGPQQQLLRGRRALGTLLLLNDRRREFATNP